MRIAFCGASGTGKTTLSNYVAEKYGLPINPVGSRSVAKAMGFDNPYDVDKAGKRAEFQRRLVTEKRAWEDAHESFVVDRTTLDNLAYTMLHDVYAVDDAFLESSIGGMARYTHVIYCPVEVFCNPAEDPSRVQSPAYHRVYDIVLWGLFSRGGAYRPEGLAWSMIPIADWDARLKWVDGFLARNPLARDS